LPSVSQVALRPAIAIPMFFGYAFGPAVGFFTGAVGNMVGDALTGFGLSPQWSAGNGLIGLIAGLITMSMNKNRSANIAMIISVVLALVGTAFFLTNQNAQNQVFFGEGAGQITLLAGLSALIGSVLVVAARFLFAHDPDIAGAVTWSLMGNFIGIGFASLSDVWINGFSPVTAIVGEFVPAAGPNAIFAVILVPILVIAYQSMRKQTGR
jgi:energy-coupling factor transport system substrate-specific component